ncbi:MAG: ATP-dependent Clp protease ATP-binding subunit [Anaerolineae bacterium]|nr:ATP-dependent Clp protease ATP-binding subunit [Anaerolineae bacterium]
MSELTQAVQLSWRMAAGEAAAACFKWIEPAHLLIGICSLEKVMASGLEQNPSVKVAIQREVSALNEVLTRVGLETTALRRKARRLCGKGDHFYAEKTMHRSPASREIFEHAYQSADPDLPVTILHLLAALVYQPDPIIAKTFEGVDLEDLRSKALQIAQSLNLPPVKVVVPSSPPQKVAKPQAPQSVVETPYLDRFGRDLTEEARLGKLGPIIGRRKELLQVIQTLARNKKNNPVLVGEAGVGKTAIVEALAIRAVQGKDASILAGTRIVEVNMGSLLAGTTLRGQFEERLENILSEAATHPDIILFIDELHTVVGAGHSLGGNLDAANIMKPALARGLRCIGATTVAEYCRYIESDSALERRFEKIIVVEPSPEETFEILMGLRSCWEEHHGVRIQEEALRAAVNLSIRFDVQHQLPDKAIDLVDKACARVRVPVLSAKPGDSPIEASSERMQVVSPQTISQTLSEKTGIPLELITGQSETMSKDRLLGLGDYLKARLVGQDKAVEQVSRRLIMAHSGLERRRGPLAVFLFLGPTGVGKTELARALAAYLFGSENDMIRLDMSEYMDHYNVARLIGSPPGYVGHEEEGQLTGALRARPYAVVLLDEIEKADPLVFDIFLQVFDEGRLTDSKGRTADARNAIFIMTSNISTGKSVTLGFGTPTKENKENLFREVIQRFRPEFINRIDDMIIFRALDEGDVHRILETMLAEIKVRLSEQHGVKLQISEC